MVPSHVRAFGNSCLRLVHKFPISYSHTEWLEEVDCLKYLGSLVAAEGGCERDVIPIINEGYRAWCTLKSVLSNRGLRI